LKSQNPEPFLRKEKLYESWKEVFKRRGLLLEGGFFPILLDKEKS